MVRFPAIALQGLIAVARGGGPAPGATLAIPPTAQSTAVPSVVESADVGASTERVEDALALTSRDDWLEAWEYYTLSFRESCPKETFAAQAASRMNLFHGMFAISLDEPVGFRLMGVTFNGSTALVSTHIFHQCEPLRYGAQDELDSWALIDGEWWNNVPAGPEWCVN